MCDNKIFGKIDDDRLKDYVNRTRNGSEQVFYTGRDERDWDRYKADGGGGVKPNVKMHDKPDTIRIKPPEKQLYAELIHGEWHWVNGCEECNGRPRNSARSYVECEKHDVCVSCGKNRNDITEGSVWGTRYGWRCNPCQEKEDAAIKAERLAENADKDELDFSFLDSVKCPHCGTDHGSDHYSEETVNIECEVCGGEFSVEPSITISYTMSIIGERVRG